MDRVSIVILCHNSPSTSLLEALGSARAQKGCRAEVILVRHGPDLDAARCVTEQARLLADRYCELPDRGRTSALNASFGCAGGSLVIPLDAEDLLKPGFAATSLEALARHPEAAFAYCDYRVAGARKYVQRLRPYNLYELLDRNFVTCATAVRRRDWEAAGGYDESLSCGYADWEFWLRLGERGRFGQHVRRILFGRRSKPPSPQDSVCAEHTEQAESIRRKHPGLYGDDARAEIKRRWAPAVCIGAPASRIGRQTIRDWVPVRDEAASRGAAFLIPGRARQLAADSAELAALAVWGGHYRLDLPDGSMALSREAFLTGTAPPATPHREDTRSRVLPGSAERLRRHLSNAGLLSPLAWLRHPLRSAGRLIPLRLKESVNAACGRQVFDLAFYLQFRPKTIHPHRADIEPIGYLPEVSGRKRIALVTPHLGVGGAEAVLLDIAASLDRTRHEIFLMATQSQSREWRRRWEEAADHVYDLRELVGLEKSGAALYSIAVNWQIETLLVQNSLIGYAMLPRLKTRMPGLRTIDLIHSVDEDWDIVAATRAVSDAIDLRVATSETVWRSLRPQGMDDSRIRLIRAAVDLKRFSPCPPAAGGEPHCVLFAGRLDPVKRPLLLPEIAAELRRRRNREDFRFVIAGDGSESAALSALIRRRRLEGLFDLRGHVDDVTPLLQASDVVILPSRAEGVPLILLEAFACCRTVVASAVGGVSEIVTRETGVAIPPGPREVSRFAEALNDLMEQPSLRVSRAENGRKLVERLFSRDRFAEDYRALLA